MQPILTQTKIGQPLHLREAEGSDAARVLAYVHQVSQESDYLTFGAGEFELTEAQEVEFLERSKANPQSLYLLALVQDQVAGVLTFLAATRPRTRHVGAFGLSVLKTYWGQGIAGKMLDSLVNWAKTGQVIKKINLSVRTDNQRAVALYFKKGFEIEGLMKNEICLDGHYFDQYSMGLQL